MCVQTKWGQIFNLSKLNIFAWFLLVKYSPGKSQDFWTENHEITMCIRCWETIGERLQHKKMSRVGVQFVNGNNIHCWVKSSCGCCGTKRGNLSSKFELCYKVIPHLLHSVLTSMLPHSFSRFQHTTTNGETYNRQMRPMGKSKTAVMMPHGP